ncbi:hypothetical protein [Geopseudomonas aromaticivorans]
MKRIKSKETGHLADLGVTSAVIVSSGSDAAAPGGAGRWLRAALATAILAVAPTMAMLGVTDRLPHLSLADLGQQMQSAVDAINPLGLSTEERGAKILARLEAEQLTELELKSPLPPAPADLMVTESVRLGGAAFLASLSENRVAEGGEWDFTSANQESWDRAVSDVIVPMMLSERAHERQAASALMYIAPELLAEAGLSGPAENWKNEWWRNGFLDAEQLNAGHLSEPARQTYHRLMEVGSAQTAERIYPGEPVSAQAIDAAVSAVVSQHAQVIQERAAEFAAFEHLDKLVAGREGVLHTNETLAAALDAAESGGPRAGDYYAAFPLVREAGLVEVLGLHYEAQLQTLMLNDRLSESGAQFTAKDARRTEAQMHLHASLDSLSEQAFMLSPLNDGVSPGDRHAHKKQVREHGAKMIEQATGYDFLANSAKPNNVEMNYESAGMTPR